MVRPGVFYQDPHTAQSNAFQSAVTGDPQKHLAAAIDEFDGCVEMLRDAGVTVMVTQAHPGDDTPDAVFPNNWFTTHRDGALALYPMEAPKRRNERRPQVLAAQLKEHGFRITRWIDFRPLEVTSEFLEGTGSLVMDHRARLAFIARSARSTARAIEQIGNTLHYEVLAFDAVDALGRAIYHTNVVMSVGATLAICAMDAIRPGVERERVERELTRDGRELLVIGMRQLTEFAGNALFLRSLRNMPLVALSERAWRSLEAPQRQQLQRHARVLLAPLDVIECIGGGSIRCMLAEIFLPRA